MSDIDELVKKVHKLNIQQRKAVSDLIEAITTIESSEQAKASIGSKRTTNNCFITVNGAALAIGDRVRILNNKKTGKKGDTAIITKFNKRFVALSLTKNKSYTQRDSKNLELIEDEE